MSEYDELYEEIKFKNNVQIEGLNFPLDFFVGKDTGIGTKYEEGVNGMFAMDNEGHTGFEFPACFVTPKGGYIVQINWNRSSRYELVYEDGKYNIIDHLAGKRVYEDLHFRRRAAYYADKTKDGAPMKSIAQDYGYGVIFICYSNECALKDKGDDCLFCNINATKSLYGEGLGVDWKNAEQIGETVKKAYGEGFRHLTVSGGFIPERREVDYYLDVAETITDYLGQDTFNGTACVGAPVDFSVFEKYKEAGFSTIATNMEVWDSRLFDFYCPGKSKECGDHDRWVAALMNEVDVFGRYNVRSTFVEGLETKESLLSGITYLVERGVVVEPSSWIVNVGSALEGHRSPTPEWHFEIQERTAEIYINNGVTWDQISDSTAESNAVVHDLYRLKQGVRLNYYGEQI